MDESQWMRQAIRLGARGLGAVEPNPAVGCLIIQNNRVVGQGYHRRFGGPHAEVHALTQAAAAARGATAIVSLEPCSHTGKTPPCTQALIQAGIGRVVVGAIDPNPKVQGKGIRQLKRAGIQVTTGVEKEAAEALIAPFAKRIRTGLPWVIAKWAQTLDGAIATRDGQSQWISGPQSRKQVHQWRSRIDAIVVGAATLQKDDPLLTARHVRLRRQARRVVIDPKLSLSLNSALVQSIQTAPVSVACTAQTFNTPHGRKLAAAGVEPLPLGQRRQLKPMLRHLAQHHQATNVMVEGGGRTLGAFFEQSLVDEAWVFVAPKLAIDPQARRALHGQKTLRQIVNAQTLSLQKTKRLGDDMLLQYRVDPPAT